MTKKKKIIIGVFVSIGAVIILFVLIIVLAFYGGYIKARIKAMLNTPAAIFAAKEYVEEKYGEKPKRILHTEPICYTTDYTGFFIDASFYGFFISVDDYKVYVPFYEDTGKLLKDNIADNRQYDEIRDAVKDYLFDDKTLGYKYDGFVFLTFSEKFNEHDFTSVYFDGNVDKFIKEAAPVISADITYWGYYERRDEYKELLNDRLNDLRDVIKISWMGVSIYIQDPEQDLPEDEDYYFNCSETIWVNRKKVIDFGKYPALMAYGYADTNEKDDNIVYSR